MNKIHVFYEVHTYCRSSCSQSGLWAYFSAKWFRFTSFVCSHVINSFSREINPRLSEGSKLAIYSVQAHMRRKRKDSLSNMTEYEYKQLIQMHGDHSWLFILHWMFIIYIIMVFQMNTLYAKFPLRSWFTYRYWVTNIRQMTASLKNVKISRWNSTYKKIFIILIIAIFIIRCIYILTSK